jgi:hypothetical protein
MSGQTKGNSLNVSVKMLCVMADTTPSKKLSDNCNTTIHCLISWLVMTETRSVYHPTLPANLVARFEAQ